MSMKERRKKRLDITEVLKTGWSWQESVPTLHLEDENEL